MFLGHIGISPSFPFHSPYIGLMVGTSPFRDDCSQYSSGKVERLGYKKIPKDQQPNGHQAMMFLNVFKISPQGFTSPGSQAALHGTVWCPLFDYARVGVKRFKCEQGNQQHPQIGNTTVIPSTDLLAAYGVC